jgi:hypothetical protein
VPVTFRDRGNIERGTIGEDGTIGDYAEVARSVRCTFWETLEKRVAVEGEVYVMTAGAVIDPTVDVQRRDVLAIRDRRFEIMSVFPGRNLRGLFKFNHVTLRESDS